MCEYTYFLSSDLGDSVIVIHAPKLVITNQNFRLLKTVYPSNMQDEVSKLFAIYF